jgi:hypothetical protein
MADFPVAQILKKLLDVAAGAIAALCIASAMAGAADGTCPDQPSGHRRNCFTFDMFLAAAAEPVVQAPAPEQVAPEPSKEIHSGMSAIDFLRAEAKNDEAPAMKRLVIEFIAKGYRAVPDWVHLSSITKKIILQKGYRDQDVGPIAEEAARAAGMRPVN